MSGFNLNLTLFPSCANWNLRSEYARQRVQDAFAATFRDEPDFAMFFLPLF